MNSKMKACLQVAERRASLEVHSVWSSEMMLGHILYAKFKTVKPSYLRFHDHHRMGITFRQGA